VHVRHRFSMNGEHVRAGRREVVDVAVRILDHEVHVERTRGDPLDGTHDCRPMVVFGTKCLSLTSTWIRSMPSRSTTAMSRPSAPKNGRRNLHGRPASGY